MIRFKSLVSSLLILLTLASISGKTVFATETGKPARRGTIKGTITDAESQSAIEYATIALYKQTPKTLFSGGITDGKGLFELKNIPTGQYSVEVTFMGYKTRNIDNVFITDSALLVDIGTIKLEPSVNKIDDVNVIADKSSIDYKIDKKVVNVSQQLTAQSGSAVDVLENVPSIKVDIEGNVSLRGSESFTVLIDGRPTALSATDALRQIPASAIENIEIITNPSAKYEPDGTSGIVNVITKKNALEGFSGIVNASAGLQNKYNADFTLDQRANKWHYYMGADFSHQENPGEMNSEMWTGTLTDTINYTNTTGDFTRKNESYGVSGGIDYTFNPKINLGVTLRYGQNAHGRDEQKQYQQYTSVSADTNVYSGISDDEHGGSFYSAGLFYKQTFNRKEHYLDVQLNVDGRDGDEFSNTEMRYANGEIYQGKRNNESGPSQTYRLQLDYVRPLVGTQKIESGFQGMFAPSVDENSMDYYDTLSQTYVNDPQYSTTTDYTRKTFAAYAIYSGEWASFGYQAGLRGEYTYQYMKLEQTGEEFKYEKPGLFPTLHFSYQLPAEQQMMLSYTRRINRPNPWHMEPFLTWMDAYNVRRGNPDLEPEFVNSFDLGYQKKFGPSFFSAEAFYRITENKIERVQSEYAENIILNTFENVGSDYSLGIEGNLNLTLAKWYQMNLMGDIYNYKKTGTLYGEDYSRKSFNWSARMNNTFKIASATRIQFDVNYRSKSVTSQGTEAAFFVTSLAAKQDFFDRKLSATLQLRNLLGTARREGTSEGPAFYSHNEFKPDWPQVTLTLSYKINNYKVKRERNNGDGENGYEGGE